jgi:hypothetical protein
MRSILGRAAGALVLALALAATAAAADNRELITDPNVLESMGFARDATNVYRLVNDAAPEPDDFGSIDHFEIVHAKDFVGRQNLAATPAEYNGGGSSNTSISRQGPEIFYDAPVELPAGALLKEFKLYAIDNDAASNLTMFVFEICVPEGGGSETSTIIATGATGAVIGPQAVTVAVTPNLTVNNVTCAITARGNFGNSAGQHVIQKIRARWARQVSPAPATATFPNDVPTTHVFFRFVEAFARAGITGGCGPNSFCPDNPVTRGQMATFISVALGLTFP